MGILIRREGWAERMNEVIDDMRGKPYVLGECDCLVLSCRVVEAMTGVDLWPRFAGYKTKRQAIAKILSIAPSFAEAVTSVLEVQPMSARAARRGDLAMMRDAVGEDHLGVVTGRNVMFFLDGGIKGFPVDFHAIRFAWRVG